MADHYSDHFNSNTVLLNGPGVEKLVIASPQTMAPRGTNHAGRFMKRCFVDYGAQAAANGDVLFFTTMKSSDRIIDISIGATAADWEAGTNIDIGFYFIGVNHDGVLEADDDVLSIDADLGGGLAQATSLFGGGGVVLLEEDRGLAVWELLALGLQTYTVDPVLVFDLCGTLNGVGAAEGHLTFFVDYLEA